MKRVALVIAVLGVGLSILGASASSATQSGDHLIPPDPLFDKYQNLLTSKLNTSPFNCGRVTVQPAFEGEWSVSIYCLSAKSGAAECHVAYAAAERNLWQVTNALQHVERARSVNIYRADAK